MTLTVYFYDARGCSLASPERVTDYAEAVRLRGAVEAQRGVRVFLQTVEEPSGERSVPQNVPGLLEGESSGEEG